MNLTFLELSILCFPCPPNAPNWLFFPLHSPTTATPGPGRIPPVLSRTQASGLPASRGQVFSDPASLFLVPGSPILSRMQAYLQAGFGGR